MYKKLVNYYGHEFDLVPNTDNGITLIWKCTACEFKVINLYTYIYQGRSMLTCNETIIKNILE